MISKQRKGLFLASAVAGGGALILAIFGFVVDVTLEAGGNGGLVTKGLGPASEYTTALFVLAFVLFSMFAILNLRHMLTGQVARPWVTLLWTFGVMVFTFYFICLVGTVSESAGDPWLTGVRGACAETLDDSWAARTSGYREVPPCNPYWQTFLFVTEQSLFGVMLDIGESYNLHLGEFGYDSNTHPVFAGFVAAYRSLLSFLLWPSILLACTSTWRLGRQKLDARNRENPS